MVARNIQPQSCAFVTVEFAYLSIAIENAPRKFGKFNRRAVDDDCVLSVCFHVMFDIA